MKTITETFDGSLSERSEEKDDAKCVAQQNMTLTTEFILVLNRIDSLPPCFERLTVSIRSGQQRTYVLDTCYMHVICMLYTCSSTTEQD